LCSPEARLSTELEKIERAYPRHLVILAGSRRQDDDSPAPAPPSPSAPTGGILARYQLLTPALITGLLLAFFVLVPIVLFAVSALASIQSPLRVQPPKGYSAEEKKNQ
jgi:predicted secreted protein